MDGAQWQGRDFACWFHALADSVTDFCGRFCMPDDVEAPMLAPDEMRPALDAWEAVPLSEIEREMRRLQCEAHAPFKEWQPKRKTYKQGFGDACMFHCFEQADRHLKGDDWKRLPRLLVPEYPNTKGGKKHRAGAVDRLPGYTEAIDWDFWTTQPGWWLLDAVFLRQGGAPGRVVREVDTSMPAMPKRMAG